MRYNYSDIFPEHLVKIIDNGASSFNAAAWSMQDKVKAFGSIDSMNNCHKAVHI